MWNARPPAGESKERSLLPEEHTWAPWAGLLILAVTAGLFVSTPWSHHVYWINYLQDDVFYYLQIARNLATGHGSTFNRIAPTNGYHPLWMMVLTAFFWITGGTDKYIPQFLTVCMFAATLVTYRLSYLLLLRGPLDRTLASILALFCGGYALLIFQGGMEIILTVPLLLLLLLIVDSETWLNQEGVASFYSSLGVGLLCSAIVLSRIDTIIFLTMLGLCFLLQPALRRLLRKVQFIGVFIGLAPLAGYFLVNEHFFHTLLPISGMAKQLRTSHGFTMPAWTSFFGHLRTVAGLVPIIITGLILPWRWRKQNGTRNAVVFTTIYFPFVYVTILSWASEWQLWGWYFYMLRPAFVVSCMVLVPLLRARLALGSDWVRLLLFLGVLATLKTTWKAEQPELIAAGFKLQEFARTHHGTYAMGDRSGIVGYLLTDPVVQLEGLTMDLKFLDKIRKQTPLKKVLGQYGVDYYVGSTFKPEPGCFEAMEPSQAGPHSPHMTGEFCGKPEYVFDLDGVRTVVFRTGRQ